MLHLEKIIDSLKRNSETPILRRCTLGFKKIVDIALDRRYDDPQLIFESLNSTGLNLSQADLIRNYVLMGQEFKFQNKLYNDYWLPMEQRFGKAYIKWFDSFVRDYLTLKRQQITNKATFMKLSKVS